MIIGPDCGCHFSSSAKILPISKGVKEIVPMNIIRKISITRKSTFDKIQSWREDLDNSNLQLSFLLIANKTDLENSEVSIEEIEQKAEELSCPYLLCSAKSGSNVKDAFRYAAFKFLEQY